MADIRIIRGQRIVPDIEQALRFAGYGSKGEAWERLKGCAGIWHRSCGGLCRPRRLWLLPGNGSMSF